MGEHRGERQRGSAARNIRSDGLGGKTLADRLKDPEHTHPAILAWRATLSERWAATSAGRSTGTRRRKLLGSPAGRAGTASARWSLWAAYAEHPALRRPATLPEEWDDDPALVRSNAEGFRSRYSHLVRNVELWLPVAFDFTFEGEDVDGRRIIVGSATTLGRQLGELNAATWKADAMPGGVGGASPPAPARRRSRLRARYAVAVMTGSRATGRWSIACR